MGAEDVQRQSLNVFRMKLLGAQVHAVTGGSATLKDAVNEALRDWVTNVRTTYYLVGSTMGPHPYPMIVRDFQSVIGKEVKRQIRRREGTVAGLPGGLRRRRQQRHGAVLPVHRRARRRHDRRRGGGRGHRDRAPRGIDLGRHGRRAAREEDLRAAGRARTGSTGALDLGRAGLPGRRTGARLPARHRARFVCGGDRCRGRWTPCVC